MTIFRIAQFASFLMMNVIVRQSICVVIMESKSPQILIDLNQSMDEEIAKIDSTIKQWKEVKKVVKKTSKTLKWGLLGLEAVDQKINGHIDGLSFFKEDIGAIYPRAQLPHL